MSVNLLEINRSKALKIRDESIKLVEKNCGEIIISEPVLNELKTLTNVMGIPKKILSNEEIFITELETTQLVEYLQIGKISCLNVLKAFLRRSLLAQKLLNCVTEFLVESSIKRAIELDEFFKKNHKPIGPLHGIPISVKEHIAIKGLTCNTGFCKFVNNVEPNDALIIEILKSSGAIIFVRTTEPQSLMHLETESFLFGRTKNPFNINLSCGGSSGGEGALVGFFGSPLGIGTDIGGSIRSPCANQGLYGLRPTLKRLPLQGCIVKVMQGNDSIPAVIGPMAKSKEALNLFMKVILDAKPELKDSSLTGFSWRLPLKPLSSIIYKFIPRKITIGIQLWDGYVLPTPPVLRAITKVKYALKHYMKFIKAGSDIEIELVNYNAYKPEKNWEIISGLYFPDGGWMDKEAMDSIGEPHQDMTNYILSQKTVKSLNIHQLWSRYVERDEYKDEHLKHWVKSGIDVLICATSPFPAPKPHTTKYWGYTSFWNLVDYPALVFPVSTVDLSEDIRTDYVPINEMDAYIQDQYTCPQDFKDAPVALQLVGFRYKDEELLCVLEIIEEALRLANMD